MNNSRIYTCLIIVLIMLISALSGCMSVKPETGITDSPVNRDFVGTWEDIKTLERHTIEEVGDSLVVTAVTARDGEIYTVSDVVWKDGVLSWTCFAPSSGARIRYTTVKVDSGTLYCTWKGLKGVGSREMIRVVLEDDQIYDPEDDEIESYVGTWEDQETRALHTIIIREKTLIVASVIDDDGEDYDVTDYHWDNGVFSWTYRVPSTGYVVTFVTERIEGDHLYCRWKGTGGKGNETLIRVATGE